MFQLRNIYYLLFQERRNEKKMNLTLTMDQFDDSFIYFCEPIRNNIMNVGNFIRFIYSTNEISTNGILFSIPLQHLRIEKFFTKYKCMFAPEPNAAIIDSLIKIESTILSKYKNQNLNRKCHIKDQLCSGSLKLHPELDSCEFDSTLKPEILLRISGIWETETEYGLTFKFSFI